ncbi:EpsG family protein [Odoribacter lunatus]|uniref:EpsG family protein n=1 Tax=Odoribacter lunatus TaxID=2941335 RepID=UPI00203F05F6|nr:EpsG family protein [Odoribacter lunatus]
MILAFVIYIGLLMHMIGMAVLGIKMKEKPSLFNITVLLGIIPFVVILGLRYKVGIDYMSYLQHYKDLFYFSDSIKYEPLYEFLNRFLVENRIHYSVLFCMTVLIQSLFFYLIFIRKRYLLPFALLFYFLTSKIFVDLNIIRHAIATMIFIYSIRFIQERKFVKYLIFLVLAGGFHYSSFLLLPVYFLGSTRCWLIDKKIWIIGLYFFTLFLGNGIMNYLMDSLIVGFQLLGYNSYAYEAEEMHMEIGSGFGILLVHVLDLCILILGLWLKKQIENHDFTVYFRAFFIGVLLSNIFGLNVVLSRFAFPLVSVRFMILAYIFYQLFYHWKGTDVKHRFCSLFILFSYMLLFIANIFSGANQCSPFQFALLFNK